MLYEQNYTKTNFHLKAFGNAVSVIHLPLLYTVGPAEPLPPGFAG